MALNPESARDESIGRYRIEAELGRGAMGVVYRARDPVLGRRVALKTIHETLSAAESYRRRFFAEARAAAGLSHPGIVLVYDIGLDADTRRLFLALEHLEGETVEARLIQRTRLPWRDAVHVAAGIARALDHAHRKGVVHRDVKPSNIMILPDGQAKILDFGVARLPASQLTGAGQLIGTPAYMSPERSREEDADGRTDVFSLGAVLYEMVTGRRPFQGRTIPEVLRAVETLDPPPPSRSVPEVPARLDDVVARALQKQLDRRYPTAGALADALDALIRGRAPETPKDAAPPRPDPELLKKVSTTRRAGVSLRLPPTLRVSVAILSGSLQGEVFSLDQPRLVIGRAGAETDTPDVALPDSEVSGHHAAVECYGERVLLRDLGSTNGTFVGESRVTQRELEDRTEFRVGRTSMLLTLTPLDEPDPRSL